MEVNLKDRIATTAFVFRGYNITNLGRSGELLSHPAYGSVVLDYLQQAGEISSEVFGRRIDLVDRIKQGKEPDLQAYGEAIAIIVAMEVAQIRLLEQFHGVDYRAAKLAFGYSLGEVGALAASGVFDMADALKIPLAMSADCAELAKGVRLGVLFSRGPALVEQDVERLCLRINREGQGVIGISSILSPNTILLLGQQRTLQRFRATMNELLPRWVHLRLNPNRWPPMHTPIMWQRNIPSRAAEMMHTLSGGFTAPHPPVISLVTGKMSYNDYNVRKTLYQWVDHPQRLWDAVYATLAAGVMTVVHVGPEPNLVPATFSRLSDNVQQQVSGRSLGSLRLRAVSGILRRQWLASLLPSRTALLRAPMITQVNLEDWLLQTPVP